MNNKIIIAVIVAAVVAVSGYFLLRSPQSPVPNSNLPSAPSQETSQTPLATQAPVTPTTPSVEQNIITYTDSGYSPNTLHVKDGTTVTFRNESSKAMWTASDVHPSHRNYSDTSLSEHCPDTTNTAFDACTGVQPGNSWSFTFTKVGTWKYHNHLAPGDTGTIVVE